MHVPCWILTQAEVGYGGVLEKHRMIGSWIAQDECMMLFTARRRGGRLSKIDRTEQNIQRNSHLTPRNFPILRPT